METLAVSLNYCTKICVLNLVHKRPSLTSTLLSTVTSQSRLPLTLLLLSSRIMSPNDRYQTRSFIKLTVYVKAGQISQRSTALHAQHFSTLSMIINIQHTKGNAKISERSLNATIERTKQPDSDEGSNQWPDSRM
jgi:hypothetical protein